MKPEAQPRHRQDHNNTRTPWAEPHRKGDRPARHPRTKARLARLLTRAKSTTHDKRERPHRTLRRRC